MLNAGQDKRISIYQTYSVFVPLFSKPKIILYFIIYENPQEFLASQVSVLRRNKATNSNTSNRPFFSPRASSPICARPNRRACWQAIHFSAAVKALVLGNLFKAFRLDITFALEVGHLGIKMKKIWQLSYSFHYPQWQKARSNVMANLSNLNKLPNTRIFVAVENGSVEVLESAALFLPKTGTFSAKNW